MVAHQKNRFTREGHTFPMGDSHVDRIDQKWGAVCGVRRKPEMKGVHQRFQSLIEGGNADQELQNAFVDAERSIEEQIAFNLNQSPIAKRPRPANGAPMRLIEGRESQSEGWPGRVSIVMHGGEDGRKAALKNRARTKY